MTLPGGIGDVHSRAWGITGTPDAGDTTSKDIAGWNENFVKTALKAQVQGSSAWNSSSAAVWAGLRPGVPLPLAIVEAVVQQAFNMVGSIFNSIGEALGAVAEFFGLKWQGIDDAHTTAVNALREVNEIKGQLAAGDGDYYTDPLNYDAADLLPNPPYSIFTPIGGGAGSYGPSGDSSLEWKPSGFGYRALIYIRPEFAISSGKFGCAMIIDRKAVYDGPRCYLGAADLSGNGVMMAASASTIALVELVGGTLGEEITPSIITPADGDNYELYVGSTNSTDPLVVDPTASIKRNGETVWSSTDHGISLPPTLCLVVGASATSRGFGQAEPGHISSFTIFDSNL